MHHLQLFFLKLTISKSKYLELNMLKTVLVFFPKINYPNSCLATLQDSLSPTETLKFYILDGISTNQNYWAY